MAPCCEMEGRFLWVRVRIAQIAQALAWHLLETPEWLAADHSHTAPLRESKALRLSRDTQLRLREFPGNLPASKTSNRGLSSTYYVPSAYVSL